MIRLLDVRLNNVSTRRVRQKSDLAWFTKTLCNIDYIHVPSLAATKDMLDAYKKHKGDWDLYEREFLSLMRSRLIEQTTSPELLDRGCLLCSEEKPHHCHRRLVAEYLRDHWGNVEIEHIP